VFAVCSRNEQLLLLQQGCKAVFLIMKIRKAPPEASFNRSSIHERWLILLCMKSAEQVYSMFSGSFVRALFSAADS
jgi:hypothetical protein